MYMNRYKSIVYSVILVIMCNISVAQKHTDSYEVVKDKFKIGSIRGLSGVAQFSMDGKVWRPVKIGDSLEDHITIDTNDSEIELRFSDYSSLRINNFSKLCINIYNHKKVNRVNPRTIVMTLYNGSLSGVVRTLPKGSKYTINIKNASITIIKPNTHIVIHYGKVLRCYKGSVLWSSLIKNNKIIKTKIVKEGYSMTIPERSDGAIKVYQIDPVIAEKDEGTLRYLESDR